MKNIYYLFACLTITALACGMQAQTPSQLGSVNIEPTVYTLPVNVLAVEPTESAPVYVTTAPLNVRGCASASCEKLGIIPEGEIITVFILDIHGDDCYQGEWYAMEYKDLAGYVCSLYVKEK